VVEGSRAEAHIFRAEARTSRVEARTLQVEAHTFRAEFRAWLAKVHTSRRLRFVPRRRLGRIPLQKQAAESSVERVGLMLRAFNQDASSARASTGEITSSLAKALIGTATGTAITITFGVAIAAASVNGTWIIFDEGFYPDDYYPYGYYPYDYSYDNYNAASVYPSSSYDSRGPDSIVLEVQEALQTAGYEPGSTDGVFGPSTREAIGRYQRDHGLDITGDITDPVLQALGLE
jgi:Putative peptidoglycan binding domain